MDKSKTTSQPHDAKPHRSAGKTVVYILTVLLLAVVVIAFVGGPAISGFIRGNRFVLGSYADQEITFILSPEGQFRPAPKFFLEQYQEIAEQAQTNGQDPSESLYRQIWRAAYDRTVFHYAMLNTAEDAGMGVSQDLLDQALAQRPEFMENGRFSAEAYNQMSSQARLELRNHIEELVVDQMVRNDIFGAVPISQAEKAFLVGMAGPERQFRYVQFGYEEYPDSEVLLYAEENVDRFRKANLSVITISSSESDAESIREQAVNRTSSFEDLARNQSRDVYAADGGNMDWIYYHQLEPDYENISVIDEIFALRAGDISEVFQTTYGWTIYRMDEEAVAPDLTDVEIVGDVRDYMQRYERGRLEDYLAAQAEDFVTGARATDFASAAAALNQLPQTSNYFPVNYANVPYFSTVGSPTNTTFANAAYDEDFFKQAFALADGEVSEPIVVRNYVFVMQLADERQVEESTSEFLEAYMQTIVQQFITEDVQSSMIDETLWDDNFNVAYNEAVRGN